MVRLVLDLKAQVKPQLFSLQPVAEYGHRLVLDVYPLVAIDPLMALAQRGENVIIASAPAAASVVVETPGIVAKPTVAEPTRPAPLARTELSNRILLVAVDAGHGGEDPGARGRRGTHEKDVTLSIARRLKAQIDETPGMRAILIRDGDYFIPLGGRVEKARKAHADLFVSIHADAFVRSNAHGSSVFALSEHGATSASANWLAKKENEADLIGGVNLSVKDPYLARTLLDLSQTATISDSMKLAKHVLKELGGINTLHRGRVEQAGFAVLKSPDTPSILVETAFISNPTEELRLKDDAYQDKLARAILGGVKRYFAQSPALAKPRLAQGE
jgi:N-acetylmuramoyl-L-alanine amidase